MTTGLEQVARARPTSASPTHDRARHVGPVAVDDRPEVDDDELAWLDTAARRPSVWEGAVRPARDDRLEGDALRTSPAHLEVERGRELLLGRALAQELFHLREGDVGDVRSPLDPGELALVLDDAERLDRVGDRDQLRAPADRSPQALLRRPR